MKKSGYKFANKAYILQLLKHDVDYFRAPLELIKKYCDKDMSILDIGCGTGNFVKILSELGYKNLIGVDIEKDSILEGRKLNKLQNIFSLDEINLKEQNFDTVICIYTIEHIEDMKKFLNLLLGVLRAKGILLIVTPNTSIPEHI